VCKLPGLVGRLSKVGLNLLHEVDRGVLMSTAGVDPVGDLGLRMDCCMDYCCRRLFLAGIPVQ